MRQLKIGEESEYSFLYIALTRLFVYIAFFDHYIGGKQMCSTWFFPTEMDDRSDGEGEPMREYFFIYITLFSFL